jgi:hypothetical protein
MSFSALVRHFSPIEHLPVPVDEVLAWIRQHTDHKDIRLHPVTRTKKAFRGAFRRLGIPTGKMYGHDFDIITQVLYGSDLPDDWKRLVIVKEALHVFDPEPHQVKTPEGVRKLIPAVITPELRGAAPFAPAIDDFLGAYRAMAVLLPRAARRKLAAAVEANTRTSTEIAQYARLPDYYVGIWLQVGEDVERQLAGF